MNTLNETTFAETIKSGVVLVDFYADWCGPCKMIAPTLTKLEEVYKGTVTIAKVNTEESLPLTKRLNINAIPTVIVYKDGVEVERLVGLTQERKFREVIDRNMKGNQ